MAPCLPKHPAITQHLFDTEEVVKKEKIFGSGAVSGPLSLKDCCLCPSLGLVV